MSNSEKDKEQYVYALVGDYNETIHEVFPDLESAKYEFLSKHVDAFKSSNFSIRKIRVMPHKDLDENKIKYITLFEVERKDFNKYEFISTFDQKNKTMKYDSEQIIIGGNDFKYIGVVLDKKYNSAIDFMNKVFKLLENDDRFKTVEYKIIESGGLYGKAFSKEWFINSKGEADFKYIF